MKVVLEWREVALLFMETMAKNRNHLLYDVGTYVSSTQSFVRH